MLTHRHCNHLALTGIAGLAISPLWARDVAGLHLGLREAKALAGQAGKKHQAAIRRVSREGMRRTDEQTGLFLAVLDDRGEAPSTGLYLPAMKG